jgi:hypothetical protein
MPATPQTLLGHATKTAVLVLIASVSALTMAGALAGPYSAALADPTNIFDAPVPGFVGPAGEGNAQILHPENYVNPLFFGWADGVAGYAPAPGVATSWTNSSLALGPVTGDNFHIVSLGDLDAAQIASGAAPGSITLIFAEPLRDKTGADLVVFENGLVSQGGAGVAGQILAELAYVEVSSDGATFVRFPSRSLTPGPVGAYGTVDASNAFRLAGKHANALGDSWGTPFDLAWLADQPAVTGGAVDLEAITHVRIVDIPGDGSFKDATGAPVYDAWPTSGSRGHDLEAVGVIGRDMNFEAWQDQRGLAGDERGASADPDADGISNLHEYAAGLLPTSPDPSSRLQGVSMQGGRLTLKFCRDERATDLILEVEASSNLRDWEVIARSLGGEPFQPVSPHAPQISESSAHHIASVGVLREVSVAEVVIGASLRFLRVSVKTIP